MVELKVRKFGGALGGILPKKVIRRLKTKDGGRLPLTEAPGNAYRLTTYEA